jgi:hypothetical protein
MNKIELRKRSLDEQERHLALGMSSSEQLTPEGREKGHLHKTTER